MQQHTGRVLRGIKVVEDALKVEDFPASKEEIDYSVGDVEVEDSHGHFLPVRNVLDEVDQNRFDSPDQVVRAIRDSVDNACKKAA